MTELSMRDLSVLAERLGGRPRKDGSLYFIHWGNDDGAMWFTFEDDTHLLIPSIRSPKAGTLGFATGIVPAFFREHGVQTFVTTGGDPKAESYRWLLGIGFEHEREDGMLVGSIAEGCRFDQYRYWKEGGNEPEWHKAVVGAYAQYQVGLIPDTWYESLFTD